MARSGFSTSNYMTNSGVAATAVPLTLACRFYSTSSTALQELFHFQNSDSNQRFSIALAGNVGGDPVRAITKATGTSSASSTAGYSVNTWQHACAVFAATNSRTIYLDGANSATDTSSRTPSGIDRTYVGCLLDTGSPASPISGSLAEVAAWNVALTAEEALALSQGVCPLLVRPASLIFYAPVMGEGSPEPEFIGRRDLTITGSLSVADHPRVYRPPVILLPFQAAGGGGATAEPGVGQVDATGFAPTVQTPVTVAAGLGQVDATGFAPTIQTPVTVSSGLAQVTVTGFEPTVQTPVTVSTQLGQATVTGFAPTVQTPVTVTVGVGEATLTGFSPGITAAYNVTTGVGALTVTGYAPSADVAFLQTLEPISADLSMILALSASLRMTQAVSGQISMVQSIPGSLEI